MNSAPKRRGGWIALKTDKTWLIFGGLGGLFLLTSLYCDLAGSQARSFVLLGLGLFLILTGALLAGFISQYGALKYTDEWK